MVGTIRNIQKELVDLRTAIVFAILTFISVYTSRKYLIPTIPEEITQIGGFLLTKNVAIMIFFAVNMLMTSILVICANLKESEEEQEIKYDYALISL